MIKFNDNELMKAAFKRTQNKSKPKSLYMTSETERRLDAIAKANNISLADAVECLIMRVE